MTSTAPAPFTNVELPTYVRFLGSAVREVGAPATLHLRVEIDGERGWVTEGDLRCAVRQEREGRLTAFPFAHLGVLRTYRQVVELSAIHGGTGRFLKLDPATLLPPAPID